MNHRRNIWLYAYSGLFVLYFLQDVLYEQGSAVSQLTLAATLAMGLAAMWRVMTQRSKPQFLHVWTVFVVLWVLTWLWSPKVVWGLAYEAIGEVQTYKQFKEGCIFLLSLYVPYVAVRRHGITRRAMFWLAAMFFALALARYFANLWFYADRYGAYRFVNNSSYVIVGAMPWLVHVWRRSKLLTLGMLTAAIPLVLYGAKRGAVVCMLAVLLFSLLYYVAHNWRRAWRMAGAALLVLALTASVVNAYNKSRYLKRRVARTEKTGVGIRATAYNVLWTHWRDDHNPATKLLGNGTAQSVAVWGNYAHNDWLELLTDMGLVGCLTYLLMFMTLVRYIHRSHLPMHLRWSAYLSLVVWLCCSLFSMGLTSGSHALLVMNLAICLGQNEHHKLAQQHYAPQHYAGVHNN